MNNWSGFWGRRRLRLPRSLRLLLVGVLAFNLLWWIVALLWKNKILPPPMAVYKEMPAVFVAGMSSHVWASLRRVLIGLALALLLGWIGGILTALNKRTNALLAPLLYLSYPVPKLALLPIVMIMFGIGETTKIVMIVLILVFQLMISIRDAILKIPQEHYGVLSSMGATKMQQIRHIIIPGILPDVFSSLRVSIGIAISVLFVTETFGTEKGLGFFIVDAWMRIDYLAMYAGIVTVAIMGFVLFLAIDLADVILCRWKYLERRSSKPRPTK